MPARLPPLAAEARLAASVVRALPRRRWLLAFATLGWLGPALHADPEEPLDISVRSMVPDKADAHGKIYAILSVQQVNSDIKLVKEVDEKNLLRWLLRELETQGFRPAHGQQAEILLTVQYGRAWLKDPYDSSAEKTIFGITGTTRGATQQYITNQSLVGSAKQLMDELSTGYLSELEKAQYEKLYVRVTAWEYPVDPKARARMLWMTTMIVDDPDHRDLNVVAASMLDAGAPYFDHEIKLKDVHVTKALPEGRVSIGVPEVIGPEPPQPAVTTGPTPAVAKMARAEEPQKQFDVPAGNAIQALQAFSRQSGEEIIYPSEPLRRIKTNAVSGKLGARAALERMLAGTGLTAVLDEKTGAFVIH